MPKRLHLAPHLTQAELTTACAAAEGSRDYRRWQILVLVSEGCVTREIEAATGFSACWIGRLVRRYNRAGPDGLRFGRQRSEPLADAGEAAPPGDRRPPAKRARKPRREAKAPPPRTAPGYLPRPSLTFTDLSRRPYASDLSDEEWAQLEPLLPPPKRLGRRRRVSLREVVNGILYILRSGANWRLMPHDLPAWRTIYGYFREWLSDGTWERLNQVLRERERARQGREPTPSAAVIDSQSVKTTEKGGRGATTGGRS